ncbi:MAG: IPT/TIG domain-containing protein [Bacillota bacterium]|nr:IPT/TIG domain-containing protein [Bacillota bacterium]
MGGRGGRGRTGEDRSAAGTSAGGTITVVTRDITTGALIPEFKFIVSENNVGDPQADLPEEQRDPARFPSLKPAASHSPVVAAGEASPGSPGAVTVPDGSYLVSVLAPGYKMGGAWVTVAGSPVTAEAWLHPHPLPLSKIRVRVFHDNSPVNGEDDTPLETGLEGFRIVIEDAGGEVTVDYFGNPLGTRYEVDAEGNILFDELGSPVRIPGTGGRILTDANGEAVIENLPPGKYGVQAIPPDGTDWIQTSTIEGTHVIDVWIEEGNDGYSPREGFRAPLVWIGFVRPMEFPPPVAWTTGEIRGRVRTIIEFVPPVRPLVLGDAVDRPWIALTDIGRTDRQVYTGRGDADGTFTIRNVPPGVYQMAIWDEPLDHIISFRTVQVEAGQTVDMGDIGIPRWFGYLRGSVFHDPDADAARQPGEGGIPNVEAGTRFKDGSVQYRTVSDMRGNYALDEVFELERFAVAEVGFTRLAATGATATPDSGIPVPVPTGCTDPQGRYVRCPETHPGALTLAELTWAAKTNRIDWGKKPYGRGENGGISGMVYYATMRNEIDPRYAVAEDYEPGVPGVRVNLYDATVDHMTGAVTPGRLRASVTTDAWEHPTGCRDPEGNPVPCIEVPGISNQVRPGVFDGAYAFAPLPPGTYVVEVVPPPGYRVLDENAVNTGEGDVFAPAGTALAVRARPRLRMAPAPYLPLPHPPYYDPARKVVTVRDDLNATADFFIYTDVPVPGRIVGFLLDDVNIETDPNRIYYGEKRGIPDTPVGIRDFRGRLITTVHSDINGIFEVLLPSTHTRNVPTPSGVAPGMYQIVGNDPGDPDRPNARYNPNYQTLKMVFDVWPGKTTYADVALFPITAFVARPAVQFAQPPRCDVPPGRPELFRVDRVHVEPGGPRQITVTGRGFGATPGVVTLDGLAMPVTTWADTSVTFEVPAIPGGPKQLLITNAAGQTCANGITVHVLDAGYHPPIITVPDAALPTVQSAIDAAADCTLIIVAPGTYHESPIICKNVKLQGMGAGDTVIDGRFFLSYLDDWLAKLQSIEFDGPELVPPDQVKEISRGQVITVVAKAGSFSSSFPPQVDGFTITGARGEEGGGIYVNAHCQHLIISNNVIRSNGGGFGGGITIGKAYAGDNHNGHIRIHHNRVVNNGGISLAGGIGIFNGAEYYEVDHNEICGNYSAEYGGGISHFGLSDGGSIHHNCILFNASFDEGAGVFVGGEQPLPPEVLSAGSGRVDIYNNLIAGNVANDDGGGIRLLQPRDYRINIYNNFIVNNVSTDLGGGIALDDASMVVICNNTIAKNITTATAEDSDGRPHAAGLVSETHSDAFRATLPPDDPGFSNPVLFNNIFWDNRAGVFDQTLEAGRGGIAGIGAPGDPRPVNVIDLEVFGAPAFLEPQYCTLSRPYPGGSNNRVGNPMFVREYDTRLTAVAFNMEADFKTVRIVTAIPEAEGDYHLTAASTIAIDRGTPRVTRVVAGQLELFQAPARDFDGDLRPRRAGYDIGADEL